MTAMSATRRDRVPKHADALHLELDHVAGLEPTTVAVLEDAAGADGPRTEHVSGVEPRVPDCLLDHPVPREVHVTQLPAGALLAVDPRDHQRARAVELVRRDDDRSEGRREVLAFGRPEPDPHLRPLEV